MTSKRILKYVTAFRRIQAVAEDERRARGDDLSYQMDIDHDCEMRAHQRAGLNLIGYKGLAMSLMNAFYASLVGAAVGGVTALIRDDSSQTTLFEVLGGDLGGAALGLGVSLGLWRFNERLANTISRARDEKNSKNSKSISEHQRRYAHSALADSELSKLLADEERKGLASNFFYYS